MSLVWPDLALNTRSNSLVASGLTITPLLLHSRVSTNCRNFSIWTWYATWLSELRICVRDEMLFKVCSSFLCLFILLSVNPAKFVYVSKVSPRISIGKRDMFALIDLKWEVIVRLVDISGIVGHRWWDFLFINGLFAPNWRYLQLHVYNVHTQIYHIKYAAIEYVFSLLVRMFRSIIVPDEQPWKGSLWHP